MSWHVVAIVRCVKVHCKYTYNMTTICWVHEMNCPTCRTMCARWWICLHWCWLFGIWIVTTDMLVAIFSSTTLVECIRYDLEVVDACVFEFRVIGQTHGRQVLLLLWHIKWIIIDFLLIPINICSMSTMYIYVFILCHLCSICIIIYLSNSK